MNTRRCELCGRLYGGKEGSASVDVPTKTNGRSYDRYSTCVPCSLKIYNFIEELKTSDENDPEAQSALTNLIQEQNAEIRRIRRLVYSAYNELSMGCKFCGEESEATKSLINRIGSAMEHLYRTDFNSED